MTTDLVSEQFEMRIVVDNRFLEFHGPADITVETTDAIVNAANSHLLGGGGVDGAIHDTGGPHILEECRRYIEQNGLLPPGQAMITSGGQLAAKYVIHTVGPVYRDGTQEEDKVLASCYRECIREAENRGIRSIAFPAISTGAFRYPTHLAARIAVDTIICILEQSKYVARVRFVLFDVSTLKAYTKAAEKLVRARPKYRLEKASS